MKIDVDTLIRCHSDSIKEHLEEIRLWEGEQEITEQMKEYLGEIEFHLKLFNEEFANSRELRNNL